MWMRINRRTFLAASGLAALSAGASVARRSPNIVFILADDMAWSDAGCYGSTFHETPNIDRLASEGLRFTDAYAACPVCSPTRASIMSGQYPAHVGVTDFIPGHWRPYEKLRVPTNRTQYLPLEVVTVAEGLKEAGYRTGAFGKWHLGGPDHSPGKQGFDVTLESGGTHQKYVTRPAREAAPGAQLGEVLTDAAVEFIEASKDKPFFLYLSHHLVHIPLQARPEIIEKYEKKAKPPEGINNPIYAAMVEQTDNSVGRVLAKLKEQGLEENTLVIFFSDNGGLRQIYTGDGPLVCSNAPLRGEKGTLYEGGIREPLIVRWPGVVAPGGTCATPVTSVDFFPTLMDAAGAHPRGVQPLDGVSLMPLLRGTGDLQHRPIFWHYPHYHHSSPAGAIREGDWKLIEYYDDGHVELYNLREDLGETTDLAERYPRRAWRLRKRLGAWRRAVNAEMPTPNPDFDPARRNEWGWHPDRPR